MEKKKSVHLDDLMHKKLKVRASKKGVYIEEELADILKKELEVEDID